MRGTIYKSFNEALERNYGHAIRMNENMHGFVQMDDINISKISPNFVPNHWVRSQTFKPMTTKSGRRVFAYIIDATDNYDFDNITSKPLAIYRREATDNPCVRDYGVFTFKQRVGNRLYFIQPV